MAVDYDLVILSGTAVGRAAARQAAQLQARVALVELPHPTASLLDILPAVLTRAGQQAAVAGGVLGETPELRWAQHIVNLLDAENGVAPLLSLGVDVLRGEAEFCQRPAFGVRVGDRVLRSRTFLLLLPPSTCLPNIAGLDNTAPLTPESLTEATFWRSPPETLVILGNDERACELAQGLSRCGISVTLIADTPLLPALDPAATLYLQALLEADGVRVIAPTPIEGCRWNAEKRIVQTAVGAIAADHILVTGTPLPTTAGLNLGAAGIMLQAGTIPVNRRYQTANPRIYACPGNASPLARQATDLALNNALFFPVFPLCPLPLVPVTVATDPPLLCFGLTEQQARQRWGDRVYLLQQDFRPFPQAHLRSQPDGLCRLLVRRNGRLVGGQLRGAEAPEWGSVFLLMHQQQLRLSALEHLPLPTPSMIAIGRAIAQDWRAQERDRWGWMRHRLDLWFDARRTYFRN